MKYQANSSCVIMSVILMTTLFNPALTPPPPPFPTQVTLIYRQTRRSFIGIRAQRLPGVWVVLSIK